MNFSGKVTNSIISFLHIRGADLAEFYENSPLPPEFLKDPTTWLDAHNTEKFLQFTENWCTINMNIEQPLVQIGHSAKELKSWGVLDSVLRMIEKPQDIFLQPQRFISYFISPAPPIANTKRHLHSISFDIPISYEEFPHMANYLRAAIEAVPLFMGAQMAECHWRQNTIAISWQDTQSLLEGLNHERRQLAPEFMQNLVATLEKTELALLEKTRELEKIKFQNTLAAKSQVAQLPKISQPDQNKKFQQNVLKLQDYFTRSQQLITLLVGQDRMNSQVREAMKRVNWQAVQEMFPKIAEELLNPTAENDNGENFKNSRTRDPGQPWLSNN